MCRIPSFMIIKKVRNERLLGLHMPSGLHRIKNCKKLSLQLWWGRIGMHPNFQLGNPLDNVHLKDRDGDGRTALRWNLRKLFLRTKCRWRHLKQCPMASYFMMLSLRVLQSKTLIGESGEVVAVQQKYEGKWQHNCPRIHLETNYTLVLQLSYP
jgi:hypothetical protein